MYFCILKEFVSKKKFFHLSPLKEKFTLIQSKPIPFENLINDSFNFMKVKTDIEKRLLTKDPP